MNIIENDLADSVIKTNEHIRTVRHFLDDFIYELLKRGTMHDNSKIANPVERDGFAIYTKKLAGLTYGSDEYKNSLAEMQEFINFHYAENRHHPEHFELGINEMTLIDLVEMLCDWVAATKRHNDGNVLKSIDLNQSRFNYSDELKNILMNTVLSMPGAIDTATQIPNLIHTIVELNNGDFVAINQITKTLDEYSGIDEIDIIDINTDIHYMTIPTKHKSGYMSNVILNDALIIEIYYDSNFIISNITIHDEHVDNYSNLSQYIGYFIGQFKTE